MTTSELNLPEGVAWEESVDAGAQATLLAGQVADVLRDALAVRGQASLLVSGGRSPALFLEALSEQPLEWSRVHVGLVDERWVAEGHADSNATLVRRHLLRGAASAARFHPLHHDAESLEQAAERADRALGDWPQPTDVVVLGMGNDGHTASLFPQSPGLEEALDPEGRRRCLPMWAPQVPHQRLTLTLSFLAPARRVFLLLEGEAKRATLARALSTDATSMPIRAFLHAPLSIHWCPSAQESRA
ncbi:6-phosphogluconolactonase [Pseudomonas sp. RIT-PI-AD]|uniref:6-phosphogluconolactonase n=1 Tax=Pseudomonas sp. RIT-PI-AD TaxID=3035294 RepID=UPI0021D88FC6|nr:6-phosphogluconolactonase [Pseudomonas sp. RIT-PI-AD]